MGTGGSGKTISAHLHCRVFFCNFVYFRYLIVAVLDVNICRLQPTCHISLCLVSYSDRKRRHFNWTRKRFDERRHHHHRCCCCCCCCCFAKVSNSNHGAAPIWTNKHFLQLPCIAGAFPTAQPREHARQDLGMTKLSSCPGAFARSGSPHV